MFPIIAQFRSHFRLWQGGASR